MAFAGAIAFAGAPVPVITDPRLREVDYGDLNGAPVDVVHRQRRDRIDQPFPGGQSYREATDAVSTLLDELLRDRDGQRVLQRLDGKQAAASTAELTEVYRAALRRRCTMRCCSTFRTIAPCSRPAVTTGRRRGSTDGWAGLLCTRASSTTATSGVSS